MKTIALAFNLPLTPESIRSQEALKAYPGAGFIPYLVEYAEARGIQVLPAQEIRNLDSEVVIIQEENNRHGHDLHSFAKPKVVFSLESPIYAPGFYDSLKDLSRQFEHTLAFFGAKNQVYFPAFDLNHRPALFYPISNYRFVRPFMSAVVAAKHHKMLPESDSESFKYGVEHQLQTKRFEAIEYFQSHGLTLYGKGWPNRLECDNKIDTIAKYKFNLCYENGSYPGYVTEKIFDAMVAGTIPVYLGAPDILQFVPADCFVDARQFNSLGDMRAYLEDMPKSKIHDILNAGQSFLKSQQAYRHSYQGFAQRLLEMCI